MKKKCGKKLCEYFLVSESTAAVHTNARNVFDFWNTGIVSSNPTRGEFSRFLCSSCPVYEETLRCVCPIFEESCQLYKSYSFRSYLRTGTGHSA
jgi:hypothetical protein